jgi:hypothetical protein
VYTLGETPIFRMSVGIKQKNQPSMDWFVGIFEKSLPKKRETGFGPATFSLARRRTTTVLLPRNISDFALLIRVTESYSVFSVCQFFMPLILPIICRFKTAVGTARIAAQHTSHYNALCSAKDFKADIHGSLSIV